MIGICPKCGNHQWDKTISTDKKQIICPLCNHSWHFKSLPLFILTGCSGVGKTTTAQELLQRKTEYIVMDGDMFGMLGEDYGFRAEQLLSFSKNIMQSGKPLLWTMAGALEKFMETYNSRFIKEFHFLALVCDEKDLEYRMREGRKIDNEDWIQGSIGHNNYLKVHNSIDGVSYEKYDITGKRVSEVADYVDLWIRGKLHEDIS
jgi:hypothetical protein